MHFDSMQRKVDEITYTLNYKSVKRMNLRVKSNGSIHLSVHYGISPHIADAFVLSKMTWIKEAIQKVTHVAVQQENMLSSTECLAIFEKVCDGIYPQFIHVISEKPTIKVRFMKTRWGVCNVSKRIITFNTALASKPMKAIEYVAMHEFAHFIYPNHQADFHTLMQSLMPDYKQRQRLLK